MQGLMKLPSIDVGAMAVLEERFPVTPSRHERVQVSQQQGLSRNTFNTLRNPVTREVTITGVELRWDGSNDVLEAFTTTRDVRRLVVIADEIHIEEPLQWKGASVEIYARRLVFRGKGQISTTPEHHATEAFSEKRSKDGRPLDEHGKVKAKDGRDGEAGGDIHLFVAELEGCAGGALRLVADGSPGEMGERGGLLAFVPQPGGAPKKDVEPLTRAQLEAVFADPESSRRRFTDIELWHMAGDVGSAGLSRAWTALTRADAGKDQHNGPALTDVRIGMGFRDGLDLKYRVVRLPKRTPPDVTRVAGLKGEAQLTAWWGGTTELNKPWIPSNGEDAFPSGATGRGGAGGQVHASVPGRLSPSAVSNTGGPSESSPDVSGGEPGSPRHYAYGAFGAGHALASSNLVDAHKRRVGTTQPGQSAKGSAKGKGKDGGEVIQADALAWMEPRLMRMVADFARELYVAGSREDAWDLVAPYWRAASERRISAPDPDARASLGAIENLVQNYQQNLDVYGNPPGWVPRFSASSYLRTYLNDRKFSYRFVGVMNSAMRLMSSIGHAHAMLRDLSASTEEAIDQLHAELFNAYERYGAARETLDEVKAQLDAAQKELDRLESEAMQKALIKEQERAIVKAIFSISAAVLAAIPVYQPALAGVGAIVKSVGGVVDGAVYGPKPPSGWEALSKISKSVATVVEDNAQSFRGQLTQELKSRYKDKLDPDSADLRTLVAQMRTAIAEGETTQNALVAAHKTLSEDSFFSDLLATDQETTERLTAHAESREQLVGEIAKLNRALDDLGDPRSEGKLPKEVAAKAGQRLRLARAKLYTLLANAQNEIRDLERRASESQEQRAPLVAQAAEIEEHRAKLEKQSARLGELLPDFEKLEATDKMKKANATFGKALDGVERIAQGAATISSAIHGAIQGPDPESEEVLALKQRILEGPLGEEYKETQAQVDEATAKMTRALLELASCNQSVATLTADFSGALQTSIDIARNRQAFALGLDAGLKASFGAMQRQARQRMDYYLYLFRKAYMYEYCALPGSEIANLNTFIERLDEWLKRSRAAISESATLSPEAATLAGIAQLRTMDGAIGDAGNDAMKNTLSELASQLLQRRGQMGLSRGNSMPLSVGEAQRGLLASQKRVDLGKPLDLVGDAEEQRSFLLAHPLLRITGISIKKGDFVFQRPEGLPEAPIRVVIEVGRELVLWDGKRYVLFRLGKSETPLQFGFMVKASPSPSEKGLWEGEVVPDGPGGVDDVFTTVMAELGQTIKYAEINPSFLSPLAMSITLGGKQIERVTRLTLTIGWQAS